MLVMKLNSGDNNAECPEVRREIQKATLYVSGRQANPTCATSTSVKLDEREYRLLWESVVQAMDIFASV